LTAHVTPTNASDRRITWTVTSGNAVTVNRNTGMITGQRAGTAIVRATSVCRPNIWREVRITVVNPPPPSPVRHSTPLPTQGQMRLQEPESPWRQFLRGMFFARPVPNITANLSPQQLAQLTGTHPTISTAPRGPFSSTTAAARAWANHMHSTSFFVRHEHAAAIYRVSPGVYRLTATVGGTPHSVASPIQVPRGTTLVADVHSHPISHEIGDEDKRVSRRLDIITYVSAPTTFGGTNNFHLLRYTPNGSTTNLGRITLRALSQRECAELTEIYRASWNRHITRTNMCFWM
ncbi:MAG: Ig-like domain-containing protein, partial [Oscillospiraceae bacterium]|nr:Ig-like domain-containing protein [Oscillospiraceae bacterium]